MRVKSELGRLSAQLIMPANSSFSTIIYLALLCLGPSILVGVATSLIRIGLTKEKVYWPKVASGLFLLSLICAVFAALSVGGEQGVLLSRFFVTFPMGVAALSGVVLVRQLAARRILIGLVVGVVFPLVMLIALPVGYSQSSEMTDRRNGENIVTAIEQYHADKKVYPNKIQALVPEYLAEIPRAIAGAYWGQWAYSTDSNLEFSLGYWYYNDEPQICFYRSKIGDWSCGIRQYSPFDLVAKVFPLP